MTHTWEWQKVDFRPDHYGYRLAYVNNLHPEVFYEKVVGWITQRSEDGEFRVAPAVIRQEEYGIEPEVYDYGTYSAWERPIKILDPEDEPVTQQEVDSEIVSRQRQIDKAVAATVEIVREHPGIKAAALIDAMERNHNHTAAMKARDIAAKQGAIVMRKLEDRKEHDGWAWAYYPTEA